MRTTIDIPDDLLLKVRVSFAKRTKRSLVIDGLKKLLASSAYDGLAKAGGKLPRLNVPLTKLRKRDHYKKFL